MSAIARELPEEVKIARDGILAFAEQEVIARHDANKAFFEDPRRQYREDGRFSDELIELINDVRMESSKSGFYHMCVPESLGGGGLGHLAYYLSLIHI